MIEGCIVAKLVLGYLEQEGLYRTCSAFQEECSIFHDSNKELDNVFLTADLKTILDDYSQLRESGRENVLPRSTAVLKSLWKDLEVVIGKLKYATIPSNTPKPSMNQSTRTRRYNNARARRNMLPRTQESLKTTTSSPSTTQHPVRPNENNTTEKLPLPRLLPVNSSPDLFKSSSKNHSPVLQFTSTSRVVLNGIQSTANKEPLNVHRTPSTVQSIEPAVAMSTPCVSGGSYAAKTSIDATSTFFGIGNGNDELSRNGDIVEGMFDGMDDRSVFDDQVFSDRRTENKSPPVIVIDDNEKIEEQGVVAVEEHSLPHCHQNQSEVHLRSPKRKGIQPKKRISQGTTGMSTVNDSPVKLVPEAAEVEMDLICSSDSFTPQSFLGTLLSTPLLQERLAENINKVVGSTRQHPVSDELPSDTMHSLTTTEASSDDILMTSNQGTGGDIPVKEIMDLMQGDPAFDVLFSFFGLDALDALPSAANSTADSNACTVLPETSAGSCQLEKSTSCVSSSGINLPDGLDALPIPEECRSVPGTEITPLLPTASEHQQVETPRSSSASDLHLSATSIVTDALLLLAGSPQKIPPQSQSQLDRSASVLTSGKRNPVTPPKKRQSVQERSANDKQQHVESLPSQAGLITSTFPYVRALDFNINKGREPVKGGPKKGSKSNKGAKQKTAMDQQSKAPLTKKCGGSNKRHLEASKSTPSSNAAVGFRNTQSVSPSTIVANVYAGIGPPLPNCNSAFNHSSNTIPSPVGLVVPSVCRSTSPYLVSCGPLATRSPISVCGQTTTPSALPSNLVRPSAGPVPLTVTRTNPRSDPSTSLVTPVIPLNYPVNFTSAVTSHSSPPAGNTSLGNSPLPVNHNNSSSSLTPGAANFSAGGSVQVLSPFIPSSVGSVFTSACSNPIPRHTTVAPSAVGFMNPITCPIPSPSANLANGANSNSGFPASVAVSSLSSLHQGVNTVTSSPLTRPTQAVIPGHITDSSVVSSITSSSNSRTSQEQNAGESSEMRTTSTHAVVTQATDTIVTAVIDAGVTQASVSPLSLQASNLLQSLAEQHANTEKIELRNTASIQSVTQLSKENAQSSGQITALSTSELVRGQQPLNDKSKQSVNLSKDSTIMPGEKHKDDICLVCKSPSAVPLEKGLRDNVTTAGCLPNSPGNKNGDTSTLVIMNQGCREHSAGFFQMVTSSETEGQGSSKPRRKRRRDSLQKEKEKKTKSSSRPSKKSKTKQDSINFPSDLNVEEFLSKLHYEVK